MRINSVKIHYTWTRTIKNSDEFDNEIEFLGNWTGEKYEPFQMMGWIHLNRGSIYVAILRTIRGEFYWQRGIDKSGKASSFEEAWGNMPKEVRFPDRSSESLPEEVVLATE